VGTQMHSSGVGEAVKGLTVGESMDMVGIVLGMSDGMEETIGSMVGPPTDGIEVGPPTDGIEVGPPSVGSEGSKVGPSTEGIEEGPPTEGIDVGPPTEGMEVGPPSVGSEVGLAVGEGSVVIMGSMVGSMVPMVGLPVGTGFLVPGVPGVGKPVGVVVGLAVGSSSSMVGIHLAVTIP
jgi:hypothetical protein